MTQAAILLDLEPEERGAICAARAAIRAHAFRLGARKRVSAALMGAAIARKWAPMR